MSSQCKGTTKSGSPCKITIVLPNGYCRVHQEQYVAENNEDTRNVEENSRKVKDDSINVNISEEKRVGSDPKRAKSTSYMKNSDSCKRWYIVPVLIFAFLWFIVRLVKQKK